MRGLVREYHLPCLRPWRLGPDRPSKSALLTYRMTRNIGRLDDKVIHAGWLLSGTRCSMTGTARRAFEAFARTLETDPRIPVLKAHSRGFAWSIHPQDTRKSPFG